MTRLKLRTSFLTRIRAWLGAYRPGRRRMDSQPLPSSKLISEIFNQPALPEHAAVAPPDRKS